MNIKVIIVCVLCFGLFLGAKYVYDLQQANAQLTANNTVLEQSINETNKTLQMTKDSYAEILNGYEELQYQLNNKNAEIRDLNDKLSRLDNAALKHSTMIEKRINNASDKTIKCFKDISEGKNCD